MKLLTKYILSTFGGKAVRRVGIDEACKKFRANTTHTVDFMISYGYLVRVLRGLYYVKTMEEFAMKRAVDIHKIISLGMDKLGIRWYFGLYTALKFNGVTHEFSDTIFVLSDGIFRAKDVNVGGEKVRFIKLSPDLFGFGVIESNSVKFSDVEKTILDLIYLSRYRSVPEGKIASTIEGYAEKAEKEKLREYMKSYPKTVRRVAENAGLA